MPLTRPIGHPRFFLGSDSAPHPPQSKSTSTPNHGCAAGVFTSSILLPLTAHLLESFGALERLQGFVSTNGRRFYGREVTPSSEELVYLRRVDKGRPIEEVYELGGQSVVPFMAGKSLSWEIETH